VHVAWKIIWKSNPCKCASETPSSVLNFTGRSRSITPLSSAGDSPCNWRASKPTSFPCSSTIARCWTTCGSGDGIGEKGESHTRPGKAFSHDAGTDYGGDKEQGSEKLGGCPSLQGVRGHRRKSSHEKPTKANFDVWHLKSPRIGQDRVARATI
jgi:hypothetical protein